MQSVQEAYCESLQDEILDMYNRVKDNLNDLSKEPYTTVQITHPSTNIVPIKVRSYTEEAYDGGIKYIIFYLDKQTNKLLDNINVIEWRYENNTYVTKEYCYTL